MACRPRACQPCRAGKTKCDMTRPACKACAAHSRSCNYLDLPPKPRPSKALITAAERHSRTLEALLISLKQCPQHRLSEVLCSFEVTGESIKVLGDLPDQIRSPVDIQSSSPSQSLQSRPNSETTRPQQEDKDPCVDDEEEDDDTLLAESEVAQYLSVDDDGHVNALGPTSALHNPVESDTAERVSRQNRANQLFINATLQRQHEIRIRQLREIDGVPIDLAIHLHELHWNRQHHTFLLTYRPAYTRDLISGGPYWSRFLSNALFASASKFSNRSEVRDDPDDPKTSGNRFLRRCEEIFVQEFLFDKSSIPTIVGLLLLGATYLSRGNVSKSWNYTGLAIRMVFDLGLHLDCNRPGLNAEDIEIRRRVFWGAFIIDKLQSLYLGRPVTIQLRDAHVSSDFMDTFEEHEPWTPYVDPRDLFTHEWAPYQDPTPIHSVSCFQGLCELSKLMTKIVSRFYVAGVRSVAMETKLQKLDEALCLWRANLPEYLIFEPALLNTDINSAYAPTVAPNIILINTTYQALIILLHRPFISDGCHRCSQSQSIKSWQKCMAAARRITSMMNAYKMAYTLRGAPYLASYACYVACSIHVRETAHFENNKAIGGSAQGDARELLDVTLCMLTDLSQSSPCASTAIRIIQRLMEVNAIQRNTDNELYLSTRAPSMINTNQPIISDSAPDFDGTCPLPMDPNLDQYAPLNFSGELSLYDPLFGFMDGYDDTHGGHVQEF